MKKVDYSSLNIEDVVKSAKMCFGGELELTYEQLEEKLLSGYIYMLRNEKKGKQPTMYTDKEGVLMFTEECKKLSIPAFLCGRSVYIYDENVGTKCILDI